MPSEATSLPAVAWRRKARVTVPASTSTVPRAAVSGGIGPSRRSPSVSAATSERCGRTAGSAPSIHRSTRSSRSRPASRRRSWIARWMSRASPSARSSGVSSVSMTTTSPSWWATAVPGRGVAWISTSSAASVTPPRVTDPSDSNVTAPSRAAAITAGMAEPSRLPIFGSSGLTRRSTRSDPSAMTSTALTLISLATICSSSSSTARPRSGRAIQAVASGCRILSRAELRRPRARSTAFWAIAIVASSPASRWPARSAVGKDVRWTLSGAAGSTFTTRFWCMASVTNGRIGASIRIMATSASWSVAKAAAWSR